MRFWLCVTMFLWSTVAFSGVGLLSPTATGNDLATTCSAILVDVKSIQKHPATEASFTEVSELLSDREQCFAYLLGIIQGNAVHTIKMNSILRRKTEDTLYSSMCVNKVSYYNMAKSVVLFVQNNPNRKRLQSMPAGMAAYLALSDSYPCPASNPM